MAVRVYYLNFASSSLQSGWGKLALTPDTHVINAATLGYSGVPRGHEADWYFGIRRGPGAFKDTILGEIKPRGLMRTDEPLSGLLHPNSNGIIVHANFEMYDESIDERGSPTRGGYMKVNMFIGKAPDGFLSSYVGTGKSALVETDGTFVVAIPFSKSLELDEHYLWFQCIWEVYYSFDTTGDINIVTPNAKYRYTDGPNWTGVKILDFDSLQSILGKGIPSSQVMGSHSVILVDKFVTSTGIPSGFATGFSTVIPGEVSFTGVSLGSGEAFGSHTISENQMVVSSGIPSGESFGAHEVGQNYWTSGSHVIASS